MTSRPRPRHSAEASPTPPTGTSWACPRTARGDRLLIDAAEHEQPVTWLLAPLAAGASVALCANQNPDAVAARVAAERVTRVL